MTSSQKPTFTITKPTAQAWVLPEFISSMKQNPSIKSDLNQLSELKIQKVQSFRKVDWIKLNKANDLNRIYKK